MKWISIDLYLITAQTLKLYPLYIQLRNDRFEMVRLRYIQVFIFGVLLDNEKRNANLFGILRKDIKRLDAKSRKEKFQLKTIYLYTVCN